MRLSRTLSAYLVREVTIYAGLGFLVFVSILITQNLLRRLEELVAVGLALRDTVAVLGCLFPMLAAYAVPVAFLFGVLVAMGRLSTDAEVTAMRACGVGLRGLLGPILALGIAVSLVSAVLIVHVEPRARFRLRGVLQEVASRGAVIDPGRFQRLAGRVVYVEERDRENHLRRIFIDDRSDAARPYLIFAERGHFGFDRDRVEIQLELEDGDVHLLPTENDATHTRRIAFRRLDYRIDASGILDNSRAIRSSEMTLSELRAALREARTHGLAPELRSRNPRQYLAQIHRRLALPVAPVLFALVGVPLGIRRGRGAHSWSTFLCVALVFTYYMLLSFGQHLGQSGVIPVALGLWLPNGAFALAALLLLRRARRDAL